ncbi:DNA polymerase III subunit gamma/tau [Candidatus Merdisoma sp. JLR.KK006]|uniref:DNA polymerase III subunit gamma/tau n=1 Tax=Candidatus Merdisoma sp. JLR.KK006 TaxID=3112626 RepID=UPI002FF39DB3
MSYMALYRKFRPAEFGDVKGQEHIVTTLKNQIKAERIGHAYLFCGTRGTGKTTIAKIFAKAVNCEQPIDGNPCGECAACRSIAAGTSMNVIEIDAASNNGVDNIREIRDEVAYSPTEGRYKVYIIDEVHMLSIGAFNALLKTLEEPPSYVIFILATTEAHKIPVTILSRCQRYDFRRISAETITERLKELTQAEEVSAEEKALRYIAKAADGSMRDALSLLDQCIAFYLDQDLTYDHVLDVLGAVDTEVYSALLRQTLKQDLIGVMEQIEDLVLQGRELGQFVTDFTWYLRNLLLLKSSEHMEDVLDVSTENLMQLRQEAQMIETDTLMRYIRIFSELGGQIRYASQKRVLVEVAFIKLCKPAMETNTDGLLDRIRALEKQMEEGIAPAQANMSACEMPVPDKKQEAAPVAPKALPEDVQNVVKNWYNVVNQLHPLLRTYLKDARLKALGDNRLGIVAATSTGEDFLKEPAHLTEIQTVIQKGTGKEMELVIASMDNDPHTDIGAIDMEQFIHMEIEIEE